MIVPFLVSSGFHETMTDVEEEFVPFSPLGELAGAVKYKKNDLYEFVWLALVKNE